MATSDMAGKVVARYLEACGRGTSFHAAVTELERAARKLGAELTSAGCLVAQRSPGPSMAAKTLLEEALPVAYVAAVKLDRAVGSDPDLKRELDGAIKALQAAGTTLERMVPGSDISAAYGLAQAADKAVGKALEAFHAACAMG